MRFSRHLGAAALAATAALALAGCGGGSDSSTEGSDPTYTMLGAANSLGGYGNLLYMDATGAPAKAGLKLKYSTLGQANTAAMIAALTTGKYDFVAVGASPVIDAKAAGAKLKLVASYLNGIGQLIVRTDVASNLPAAPDDPALARIRALKGMKIVADPNGSSYNNLLRFVLKKAGMDPDKDVTIIPSTDAAAMVAGFHKGLYDAMFQGIGQLDVEIANGTGIRWLSTARGDFSDMLGGEYRSAAVFATAKFADAHPDVIKKLQQAISATNKSLNDDPGVAASELAKLTGLDSNPDLFKVSFEEVQHAWPLQTTMSRDQFDVLVKLLVDSGDAKAAGVKYEDFVAMEAQG